MILSDLKEQKELFKNFQDKKLLFMVLTNYGQLISPIFQKIIIILNVLFVIDGWSKYLWISFLKSQTSRSIIAGLKDIFKSSERKPEKIMSDMESGLFSKETQNFLKENNNFYTIQIPEPRKNTRVTILLSKGLLKQ